MRKRISSLLKNVSGVMKIRKAFRYDVKSDHQPSWMYRNE